MHVAVIGTGRLGTTHAACMAQIGHSVIGVDIDPGRVAELSSGDVPFFEQPDQLAAVTTWRRIVDGRNCLVPQSWRDAGWTYRSFGRT